MPQLADNMVLASLGLEGERIAALDEGMDEERWGFEMDLKGSDESASEDLEVGESDNEVDLGEQQ